MERLQNSLLDYAWGSRTALAELLGESSPSAQPQAEMWIGAHASAPSLLASPRRGITLAEHIAADPAQELGAAVSRRFEGRLPFLLKILAVDAPLSLQAHPGLARAREGFEREESSGLARTAPSRSYRDPNHKPEILCPLGPFDALCGFRPAGESLQILEMLDFEPLDEIANLLRQSPGPDGVRAAFEALMALNAALRPAFLEGLGAACRRALEAAGPYQAELGCVLGLAEHHGDDMGVAASLLLNLVHLEAGEALYLPPGNLHTYLKGIGVELMANSDNVLRGGLTTKHVDVAELLRVLDFADAAFVPVVSRAVSAHEREYLTPTPDFRLGVIEVRGGQTHRPTRRGPELLVCVDGEAEVTMNGGDSLKLARGESVFVSASDADYGVAGDAVVYRATVGDLDFDATGV